jgi:hypothetical protein
MVIINGLSGVYLIGLDLNDGTLKYQLALPFVAGNLFGIGSLAVDSLTGDVFVEGVTSTGVENQTIFR